jgi:tRNA G18 (ribose-2'-O)-methylase SpoU
VYPKTKERQQQPSTSPSTSTSYSSINTGGNDNSNDNGIGDTLQMEAAAKRTANQIDFLVKRQTSQRTEAVRNHDASIAANADANANANNTIQFPITLVLDNLRGSFNVGSIFRTAEACGVSEILTCGITPHPFGSGAEKVAKSALGAETLVPTRHFATTLEALRALRMGARVGERVLRERSNADPDEEGTTQPPPPPFVVALETTSASQLYTSVDYRPYYNNENGSSSGSGSQGIALILGNEVTGVDVELLAPLLRDNERDENENSSTGTNGAGEALVDAIVELPTHGQKNSLNVAAVAPVILYEVLRQWDSTNRKDLSTNKFD